MRDLPEIDWHHYQGASPAPASKSGIKQRQRPLQGEVSHQIPVCSFPFPFILLLPCPLLMHAKISQKWELSGYETKYEFLISCKSVSQPKDNIKE